MKFHFKVNIELTDSVEFSVTKSWNMCGKQDQKYKFNVVGKLYSSTIYI